LLLAFNAGATTFYVNQNSTNAVFPFTSWATAATNIQQAVGIAGFGDVVLVTNGVYRYGSSSGSRANVFNAATVQSVNGPAVTVIEGYQVPGTTNGPGAIRCVSLASGATLSGFTLTNGATTGGDPPGGGVKCGSTSSIVTNCIIIGNAAGTGGGAYSGKLINCVLSRNTSSWGGGAYNSILVNCKLTGNSSGYRGGGAAYSSLTNCVLAGNYADAYGGGADASTLINCTVVSNTARYYGGGVEGGTIKNSIVYYNHQIIANTGSTNYHSLSAATNSCTTPLPGFGANNITDPPLFANLGAGDFHLNPASPCINAGNNSFIASTTDFDNNPRIVGGTVDIGAYEFPSVIHYVKPVNGAPVSPYTNWLTAATTIQDAIDAAASGDIILVTNGVYATGGRRWYASGTNRVTLTNAITLQSVNGPGVTLIVGRQVAGTGSILTNAVRCVAIGNSNAVLSGFTLTNGSGGWGNYPAGGGVANVGSIAASGTVTNCILINNLSTNDAGGGAYRVKLFNCQIIGNYAPRGGGACASILVNCIVVSNKASFGGGVYGGSGHGSSTLTNCTVVGNSASSSEGGVALQLGTMNNCIVYYNTAPFGANHGTKDTHYSCTTPVWQPTGITNAPAFIDPDAMNFRLQSNSPCINSGRNSYIITTTSDLDGNPRIVGGTVDIGAYEFQSPASMISYAYLQQYGLPTDGSADFADPDGDALNNWQEWQARTDPTNALSLLQMSPPTNGASGVIVRWQSVSGVTYFLQRASDLAAQPAFSSIRSNIFGQTGFTTFTDTTATNGGPYFYRVGVQ